MAREIINILPGEVWVNFPWSCAQFAEIVDGQTLASPVDVSVTGTTGITISGEAISGTNVLFTITVASNAAAGERTLHLDVGASGSASTNLTDTATLTVSSTFKARNNLNIPDNPNRLVAVDFSSHPMIRNGQVLTGTPTISWDDSTDLTTSGATVDTSTDQARFRLAVADGRTAGVRTGTISVATTAGSTLKARFELILE